jgi:hypothetical protein
VAIGRGSCTSDHWSRTRGGVYLDRDQSGLPAVVSRPVRIWPLLILAGSQVRITPTSIVLTNMVVHIFKNSTVAGANFGAFLTGFMFYVNLYYVSICQTPYGPDSLAEDSSCPSSTKSSEATPRCNPASICYPSFSHRPSLRSLLDFSSQRPVIIGSTSGLGSQSGRWARVCCRRSRPISLRQS